MATKKRKSTVNKAGNYTKPTMRKQLFQRIKAGGKGGKPGQWSARKAQMLAKQYKAKGGDTANAYEEITAQFESMDKAEVENQEWQAVHPRAKSHRRALSTVSGD